jgi:hypothetical protein
VGTFLQRMNLTVDGLKARPSLAKQLAAQHIILRHNVRAQELFESGPVRIVKTLAGKHGAWHASFTLTSELRALCSMQHG